MNLKIMFIVLLHVGVSMACFSSSGRKRLHERWSMSCSKGIQMGIGRRAQLNRAVSCALTSLTEPWGREKRSVEHTSYVSMDDILVMANASVIENIMQMKSLEATLKVELINVVYNVEIENMKSGDDAEQFNSTIRTKRDVGIPFELDVPSCNVDCDVPNATYMASPSMVNGYLHIRLKRAAYSKIKPYRAPPPPKPAAPPKTTTKPTTTKPTTAPSKATTTLSKATTTPSKATTTTPKPTVVGTKTNGSKYTKDDLVKVNQTRNTTDQQNVKPANGTKSRNSTDKSFPDSSVQETQPQNPTASDANADSQSGDPVVATDSPEDKSPVNETSNPQRKSSTRSGSKGFVNAGKSNRKVNAKPIDASFPKKPPGVPPIPTFNYKWLFGLLGIPAGLVPCAIGIILCKGPGGLLSAINCFRCRRSRQESIEMQH